MKLALIIVLATTLVAGVLMLLTPPPPSDKQAAMPWQVIVHDAGHSEVFGIMLERTLLGEAVTRHGPLEGIALFHDDQSGYSIEAYFGKISIGPLSARLIANLAGEQAELQALAQQTTKRTQTESGSRKWELSERQQQAQLQRAIRSLTFIPGYGGMEEDYLLARFGQPASRQKVDDNSELWLYPEIGVRILFDREGKEVFEYIAPARFSQFSGGRP